MAIPVLLLLTAAASAGFTGEWVTADRSAVVRVEPCGRSLCGHIVRVLARGVPTTDVHNPNPALRRRPLIGIAVLSGFNSAGEGGHAYNPQTGRSYRTTLRLNNDGSMRVTGCVMSLVCRSQNWTRR